jgi:hypothetical protein
MDQDQATAFIIKELGSHRNRNEIIQSLCVRGGMHWLEAEKLVKQVESTHTRDIASRQSSLVIALGIASIIGGLGLLFYSADYVVGFFQRDTLGMVLGARTAYYKIGSLITGGALVVAGIVGMWKTIVALFND